MGPLYLWALMLVAATLPAARGIWMELGSMRVKCLSEELHNNAVVLGNFYSFYGQTDDNINATSVPSISVKISSPHGNILHHKEKVQYGQFGFTANEPGSYKTCFWVDGRDQQSGRNVTIGFDWRTGIATKDWEKIAKKEKIEGLDLELRKLEDAVDDIKQKLRNMMKREMDMRDMSEETNARVAHYSIVSLGVSVLVSAGQLFYLKQYFLKKKLI